MTGPSAIACAFRPDPAAAYKLIYLAQRRPDMPAEQFPAAWRAHSQFASSFGASLGRHFLGVRQCVRDPAADPGPPFSRRYDGSSILAMRSWPDLLAARYHPHALDELLADEKRVFAGPVDDWTMAVEERVLIAGNTQDHVLLSFLTPAAGVGADEFADHARTDVARLATLPGIARLVSNRVIDPARAYPFAAVTEAWFADPAAMIAAGRDPRFAPASAIDSARSVHLAARLNLAKAIRDDTGWTREA